MLWTSDMLCKGRYRASWSTAVLMADVDSTLFLIAQIQYVYVTYLGYNALPFVARSQLLLAPLLPIFGG
jgi:hypothetical protein